MHGMEPPDDGCLMGGLRIIHRPGIFLMVSFCDSKGPRLQELSLFFFRFFCNSQLLIPMSPCFLKFCGVEPFTSMDRPCSMEMGISCSVNVQQIDAGLVAACFLLGLIHHLSLVSKYGQSFTFRSVLPKKWNFSARWNFPTEPNELGWDTSQHKARDRFLVASGS